MTKLVRVVTILVRKMTTLARKMTILVRKVTKLVRVETILVRKITMLVRIELKPTAIETISIAIGIENLKFNTNYD